MGYLRKMRKDQQIELHIYIYIMNPFPEILDPPLNCMVLRICVCETYELSYTVLPQYYSEDDQEINNTTFLLI